ncbi:MAG TPA: hypothetical protein VGB04_07475 [Allosphingosinicella sp.]|jgi:hypothetical protein
MSRWPALRINHHCDDHGELLRDSVAPLVADMRAREGVRILVRADWREGPHVLVAMDVDEQRFSRDIYEPCRRRVESWLRSNPSRAGLDSGEYRRLALLLAQSEAVSPGADRLAPDNSVEAAWYDREPPMGIADLAGPRDDFQVATLDLCLKLAAQRLESRPRFMIELATLIAAAGLRGDGEYDFWPISMLAHSEAFLAIHKAQREPFERLTAKLVPGLAQSWSDRRIEEGDGSTFLSSSQDLQAWSAALANLNDDLRALTGKLPELGDPVGDPKPYLGWDSASFKALMMTSSHLRFRIMINFVYGLFPLIGLKPVDRAFLCRLIWSTVESSAPELIARADRSVRAAGKAEAA